MASRYYNLGKMKIYEFDSYTGTLFLYADFLAEANLPIDLSIVPFHSQLLPHKLSGSKLHLRFELKSFFCRIATAILAVVIMKGYVGIDSLSAVILATSMIGALLTFSIFGYGGRLIINRLPDPRLVSAELFLWGLSGGALGIFLPGFLFYWIERVRSLLIRNTIKKRVSPYPFSPFLAALLVLLQWWLWGMYSLSLRLLQSNGV